MLVPERVEALRLFYVLIFEALGGPLHGGAPGPAAHLQPGGAEDLAQHALVAQAREEVLMGPLVSHYREPGHALEALGVWCAFVDGRVVDLVAGLPSTLARERLAQVDPPRVGSADRRNKAIAHPGDRAGWSGDREEQVPGWSEFAAAGARSARPARPQPNEANNWHRPR